MLSWQPGSRPPGYVCLLVTDNMSQVKPVLEKLRRTLLGAGVLLLTSSVLLVGLIQTGTEDGVYGECRKQTGKPFGGAVRSQLWFCCSGSASLATFDHISFSFAFLGSALRPHKGHSRAPWHLLDRASCHGVDCADSAMLCRVLYVLCCSAWWRLRQGCSTPGHC